MLFTYKQRYVKAKDKIKTLEKEITTLKLENKKHKYIENNIISQIRKKIELTKDVGAVSKDGMNSNLYGRISAYEDTIRFVEEIIERKRNLDFLE